MARELALQYLYEAEFQGKPTVELFALSCDYFLVNKKAVPYARELVSGLSAKWDEINALIVRHAANWRLSRMAIIDRNILRLAAFELCHGGTIPAGVVINEAIEIARRFSSDESVSFINGILDAISQERAAAGQPEKI